MIKTMEHLNVSWHLAACLQFPLSPKREERKIKKQHRKVLFELFTLLLQMYAAEGLRTLVAASKEIPADVYEKWKKKHYQAR